MKQIDFDSLKRIINYDLLENYGFINNKYEKEIMNGEFKIIIEIKDNKIFTYIYDNEFNDEFINIDINTGGEFLGSLKELYEKEIDRFIKECTRTTIKYHDQVNTIIKYINDKYKDEIEYLWDSSPHSGIFRNKKNKKWYAAILEVKENRINGDSEKIITVIDLMYKKGETLDIVDNTKIFKGYHMNKNSWITIKLDGTVDNEFIYKYIDISYELSINK